MTHSHNFINTGMMTRPRSSMTSTSDASMLPYRDIEGTIIVCSKPECAEVRHVWSDGLVEVKKKGQLAAEE